MGELTSSQRELLSRWVPGLEVVRDLSWDDGVGTVVWEVIGPDGRRYVVKGGGERDRHIAREIAAHQRWLSAAAALGDAPRLVACDVEAKIILTTYLPGVLVEGTPAEHDPETYRQAGALLARLHGVHSETDAGEFEDRQRRDTLAWLERPHRIPADTAERLRGAVERWPSPPTVLVPTHGDWQPRNWLVHQGRITMIDFGRTALRPAHTDFGRLVTQQFLSSPALEPAFVAGYGSDPRDADAWLRSQVRDAVSTAAWAHQYSMTDFEQQGLRMVDNILEAATASLG